MKRAALRRRSHIERAAAHTRHGRALAAAGHWLRRVHLRQPGWHACQLGNISRTHSTRDVLDLSVLGPRP